MKKIDHLIEKYHNVVLNESVNMEETFKNYITDMRKVKDGLLKLCAQMAHDGDMSEDAYELKKLVDNELDSVDGEIQYHLKKFKAYFIKKNAEDAKAGAEDKTQPVSSWEENPEGEK